MNGDALERLVDDKAYSLAIALLTSMEAGDTAVAAQLLQEAATRRPVGVLLHLGDADVQRPARGSECPGPEPRRRARGGGLGVARESSMTALARRPPTSGSRSAVRGDPLG